MIENEKKGKIKDGGRGGGWAEEEVRGKMKKMIKFYQLEFLIISAGNIWIRPSLEKSY